MDAICCIHTKEQVVREILKALIPAVATMLNNTTKTELIKQLAYIDPAFIELLNTVIT